MLLAPILKNATGEHADTFAATNLFSPLGITNYEWIKSSEFWTKMEGGELPGARKPEPPIDYASRFAGFPNVGSGLKMLPRDMAKLGQLYLNKGKWSGRQLVDEQWIVQATGPQSENSAYGYGWRSKPYFLNNQQLPCFYVTGFGLQSIYVFPTLDLVVVFTQQQYRSMEQGEKQTQQIIEEFVLTAVGKD
jgi:CubicO group peptidase (beta-lactamase class C family)